METAERGMEQVSKTDPENYIRVQDITIWKAVKWENSDSEIPFPVVADMPMVSKGSEWAAYFDYTFGDFTGRYFLRFNDWIVWNDSGLIETFTEKEFHSKYFPISQKGIDIKFFEVRDIATRIPVICIKTDSSKFTGKEKALLATTGFSGPFVFLIRLSDLETKYDPTHWKPCSRTMSTAHRYIIDKWENLDPGQVIDVRYILGEENQPCLSDFEE
jgi:hypothetical protein